MGDPGVPGVYGAKGSKGTLVWDTYMIIVCGWMFFLYREHQVLQVLLAEMETVVARLILISVLLLISSYYPYLIVSFLFSNRVGKVLQDKLVQQACLELEYVHTLFMCAVK